MADTERVDALRRTDELPDDLWWLFTGGLDTCFSEHDGEYRNCCMRAGLAYVLKVHEEQLRAQQQPLNDEYGLRVTYISTLTAEGAVADTLAGALAELDRFDAQGRGDVVSRVLIQRPVGEWRKVGDDRG